MSGPKPFNIPRQWVWKAWLRVRSNKGSGGVDGISLAEFGQDYKTHLYRLWNRMRSGSYMPPAARLMEIPKKGGGTRPLGIPTIADRVGQTVVKAQLEQELEPLFHEDSYGYRPGKSAIQAVAKARQRCWAYEGVVDLDIKGFSRNIPHDLLMKAAGKHCDCQWMLLQVERWLAAPLQTEDGQIVARTKGVPQGSARRPLLANLYLHYCMDQWLRIYHPEGPFERYADDAIIHCRSKRQAEQVREYLQARMRACGLELHPEKTHMVYAPAVTVVAATGRYRLRSLAIHLPQGWHKTAAVRLWPANWLPAVSRKAMKSMNDKMKQWSILRASDCTLEQLAKIINPVLSGWINYYGHFYRTELRSFMHMVNVKIIRWARRKYKGLRSSDMKAIKWLHGISQRSPNLFAHWSIGAKPTVKTTRAV